MPLGDSLFGTGLLAEDQVARAVASGQQPPRAVKYDPKTRDFPLDENGRYEDVHPVDAAVVTRLTVQFGKVGSAPGTGNTLKEIPSPVGTRVRTDVDMRARVALRDLVQRKDIQIHAIRHESANRHTLFVEVDYSNLRTGERRKANNLSSSA